MCGISGFFNAYMDRPDELLKKLNDSLIHRGPDSGNYWINPERGVGLAHRRLSVIDLTMYGSQPMLSSSGRYCIVYNGEVYNFKELKDQLKDLGHIFKGHSDTEVILAGLDEWGLEITVKKLNGMFAAAVLDKNLNNLYLFRDRLGVKPLYYQWLNGGIFFSSELTKPFAKIAEREIDRNALALYLRHYFIPTPYTIYNQIYKLQPGIIFTIDEESSKKNAFASGKSYWDLNEVINTQLSNVNLNMKENDAIDMLDISLSRSVKSRMVSDVPLGSFLSGGIDSTIITTYMQKNSIKPIKTFTIGFDDEFSDETNAARATAKFLGTDHSEFYVSDADARSVIPLLAGMYGEPFADSSQIPTYIVSKLARQSVTVALSGDGGDELFAGYRTYSAITKLNFIKALMPEKFALIIGKLLSDDMVASAVSHTIGHSGYKKTIKLLRLLAGKFESQFSSWPNDHISDVSKYVMNSESIVPLNFLNRCIGNYTEQLMLDNLKIYLPDDILTKVDRASMRTSLEVRAPFTDDWELFNTAWSIPFHLKHKRGEGKYILKKLLERHMPRDLFIRPKHGFSIPLRKWLHGPLFEWVCDSISNDKIIREGYFDPTMVINTFRMSITNDAYASELWAICIFENWLKENY